VTPLSHQAEAFHFLQSIAKVNDSLPAIQMAARQSASATAQQSVAASVPSTPVALDLTGSPNVLGMTAGVPLETPVTVESPALAGNSNDLAGSYFASGGAGVSCNETTGTKLAGGQSSGTIALNGARYIVVYGATATSGVEITLGAQS
jgi:hypothetical protein